MSDFIERLGLPVEDVETMGDVYAGYAQAISGFGQESIAGKVNETPRKSQDNAPIEATEIDLTSAGSSWLIAGLFQALYAPQKAVLSFTYAARIFRRLGWPVWRICSICSSNQHIASGIENETLSSSRDEELFLVSLHQLYFSDAVPQTDQAIYLSPRIGYVPGLNVTYSQYFAAIAELTPPNIEPGSNKPRSFLKLLSRLQETQAFDDFESHHWQSLQGTLAPFDPIALAATMVVVKKWKKSYWEPVKYALFYEDTSRETVLLQVALSLVDARGV